MAPSDAPLPAPGAWFDDESVRRVVLRLSPAARWVVERFPVDTVEAPDAPGWSRVTLPVASEQWLVRTMLRLGPEAELVEPAEPAGRRSRRAAEPGAGPLPALVERVEVARRRDLVGGSRCGSTAAVARGVVQRVVRAVRSRRRSAAQRSSRRCDGGAIGVEPA